MARCVHSDDLSRLSIACRGHASGRFPENDRPGLVLITSLPSRTTSRVPDATIGGSERVIMTDDNSNNRPATTKWRLLPTPRRRAAAPADSAAPAMATAPLQTFVQRYVTNSEDLEFLVLYLDSLGVHTLEELNRIPEAAWETLSSWLTPGTAPALRNELGAMTGPSRSAASSPPLPSSPPGPKQAPISALSLQPARAGPKADSLASASDSDLGKSVKKDAKGDRTRNDSVGSPPPGAGFAQTRSASRSSDGAHPLRSFGPSRARQVTGAPLTRCCSHCRKCCASIRCRQGRRSRRCLPRSR